MLVVFGVAGLAAHPWIYFDSRIGGAVAFPAHASWLWVTTGAVTAVWGVSVLRTGEWRSLTPRRVALAPLLVVPTHVAVAIPPTILMLDDQPLSRSVLDVLESTFFGFYQPGVIAVGATLFGLVAVATCRGETRWRDRALAGLFVLAFVLGSFRGPVLFHALGFAFYAAVYGTGPALVGYHAAAPPEGEERPADTTTGAGAGFATD